jgi:F-type H+-transporting ATPase subunit a
MPESFSWLMFIPAIGTEHEHLAIAHAWLVVVVLLLLAVLASGKIKRATANLSREELVPEDKLTLRNFFELYVEGVLGVMEGLLGHNARKFFWLIGTLFIYIFFSNLLGVLPGFLPPTENINTNLAIGVIVFVVYNVMGMRAHGVGGYLKHFFGPVAFIAPLFFIIEIISNAVRPLSLAVRLFGNINGDHIVLGIFSQTLPGIAHWVLGVGIPIPFIALGIFVAFMQAFVFAMLSTIYIAMAVSHEH